MTNPSTGFKALISRGVNGWNAEMRIADSILGGWEHAARIGILDEWAYVQFVFGIPIEVSQSAKWPEAMDLNQPATWAPAFFGTPPTPTNQSPVASADSPPDVEMKGPTTVVLNGASSYDPEGSALTYAWTQVTTPMTFGYYDWIGQFLSFDGSMDEITLWSRALTPVEIDGLRRFSVSTGASGLIGYWPFSDGAGPTASDASGNGHHGCGTDLSGSIPAHRYCREGRERCDAPRPASQRVGTHSRTSFALPRIANRIVIGCQFATLLRVSDVTRILEAASGPPGRPEGGGGIVTAGLR